MTRELGLQLCEEDPNQFQCQGVGEDAVRGQRGNKIRFSAGWAGLGWAGWAGWAGLSWAGLGWRVTALPQHIPVFVPLGQPGLGWAGKLFWKVSGQKRSKSLRFLNMKMHYCTL